jgi:hypothetical protein
MLGMELGWKPGFQQAEAWWSALATLPNLSIFALRVHKPLCSGSTPAVAI